METYVIITRILPEAISDPAELPDLARKVCEKIKLECPEVVWKDSYAVLGRFDVLDIIEAPSRESAERAALVIRSYGHATTEILAATPWKQFIHSLVPERETVVEMA
jgi:uncharacterized protein with GYD domain